MNSKSYSHFGNPIPFNTSNGTIRHYTQSDNVPDQSPKNSMSYSACHDWLHQACASFNTKEGIYTRCHCLLETPLGFLTALSSLT